MSDVLRLYHPEVDPWNPRDGYPYAWSFGDPAVKDLVREQAEHRCVRCHHPYVKGAGEWSPCDELCTHDGPISSQPSAVGLLPSPLAFAAGKYAADVPPIYAQWRILTVHHLNGVKGDCRWWNLAALCQRCHLVIQGRVVMERVYPFEHSEWFKPYAAGWYASAYLGEDLTRDETMARLDELLALERMA